MIFSHQVAYINVYSKLTPLFEELAAKYVAYYYQMIIYCFAIYLMTAYTPPGALCMNLSELNDGWHMTLALANIATVTFMIDMWGGTHAIGVLTLNMLHCFKK